jgi:RNA polymerase sigma-70 factor (ECF subfamily)
MRTPDDIHDEWLVFRCQEGDEAALGELVERWQPRLLRHAMRLTGTADAAADVVQTAWIAIIRGLGGLNDPACFRRWAYRIVGFKAADWIRARQRDRAHAGLLASEPNDLEVSDGQPQTAQDDIAMLRAAMQKLSPQQRTIVSMFYHEEMPLAEIAQALELPLGTVKSRLHYARLALKQILERRNA